MKAIVCDKCDKILPMDGDYKVLVPMEYNELDYLQAVGGESPHLCHECLEKFRQWVEEREDA